MIHVNATHERKPFNRRQSSSPLSKLLSLPDTAKIMSLVVQEEYAYSLRKRMSSNAAARAAAVSTPAFDGQDLDELTARADDHAESCRDKSTYSSSDLNPQNQSLFDKLSATIADTSTELIEARHRIKELERVLHDKDTELDHLHDVYEEEISEQLEAQRKRLSRHARAVKLAALREKDKHMKAHIEVITQHVSKLSNRHKSHMEHKSRVSPIKDHYLKTKTLSTRRLLLDTSLDHDDVDAKYEPAGVVEYVDVVEDYEEARRKSAQRTIHVHL